MRKSITFEEKEIYRSKFGETNERKIEVRGGDEDIAWRGAVC